MSGSTITIETITIDLSAPARLADLPAIGRQCWLWWIGELKALAPAWMRRLLPEQPKPATLTVGSNGWRVAPDDDPASAIALDPDLDDRGLAHQIVEAAPSFSLQRLKLVLPSSAVLRRRIELPLMPQADLRAAVELQIDRLSPFTADAVRFAVRVISRDPVDGKLAADIAIAPRAQIEALEQRLLGLGFTPVSIDIADANASPLGFDLRAQTESVPQRRAMLINAAFVLGAAFAWYLASVAWDTAREREIEGWQTRIAELRPLAERSASLRRQLDAMTQPFMIARAHRPGRMLGQMVELTKLIPDSARLTELRMQGTTVELTGLAADAPGLIAKLEASKLFKDVKFRSPVTRRPELRGDRFEISQHVEGAPTP